VKRSIVMVGVLGVVSCGDNEHRARIVMEMGDDAPAYGRSPFPTDALVEGRNIGPIAGLDRMAKQHFDLIGAHLSTLDGWGLRPTVQFFIEGELDAGTIPEDTTRALADALIVMDVDPSTGEDGAAVPFDWRYVRDPITRRNFIAGSPAMGTQLREGTRYAAVVTTDVKGIDGTPVFGAYELGKLEDDPPARWQTTADAYAHIKAFPALEDRIAGITVFTTQYASDTLVKARNEIANVASVPVPTLMFDDDALIFDTPGKLNAMLGQAARATSGPRSGKERWGTDNPTGMAHDHIAVIATGKTTIARFIGDDTRTDRPDDETFSLGRDGVPMVRSIDTIPITIILPNTTMPAGGFPVIVFGHGLGGSRRDMLNLAEPLCEKGFALIGIDMWNHGLRLSPTDTGNNLGSKPDFTGDRGIRDGFSDDADGIAYVEFFESFMNLSAIRDSIRQSTLDISRVALLIQTNPSLGDLRAPFGAATPKLDPTRVAYLGQSFGTIVGTNLAAIEPSIGLYILNVPGGGLLDHIFPASAKIGELAVPLAQQLYRTQGTLDRFHPLVGSMQAIFDGADSLTFARHVLKDRFMIENEYLEKRHVVLIEAIGDEIMPNHATEALARAFGAHVLKPNVQVPSGMLQIESPGAGNLNDQTAILVQYAPATHGYNWSAEKGEVEYQPGYPFAGDVPYPKLPEPITIQEPIYETLEQVTEVLATHFARETPRVRSTLPPVADFDGDGIPDVSDPNPYDPTK
jgi:pimeloyl-ACP methyl ester carboxylesterase